MNPIAPASARRPAAIPSLLLLAGLLFWGWQSGLLLVGAVLGIALVGARFTTLRWELSEQDFRRILYFCLLLSLSLAVYVFSTNDEGGGFSGLFQGSAAEVRRHAGTSGAYTATTLLRWLPISLFLLVAAQDYSSRECIPLTAISLVAQWRRHRAGPAAAGQDTNVSYPYFIICLFSAGIHANAGTHTYFWGQAGLLAWALWPMRARRFGLVVWLGVLLLAGGLAYAGEQGLGRLIQLASSYDAQWFARWMQPRTDPTQSVTAIGQIGRLKLSGRIIIRVGTPAASAPPSYMREATYRIYRSQIWRTGGSTNEFQEVAHEFTNETSWVLQPGQTNSGAATIASYLSSWSSELGAAQGLLPLPSGSHRLDELPVVDLKKSSLGAVLAAGPGLVIFRAAYGPGWTIDAPPVWSTNEDLAVPTNEIPAIDQVLARLNLSGMTEARQLHAVQNYFSANYTYSTWQGPDTAAHPNETPLAHFLLNTRSGHCEYFATATVLLLRQMGIPARYAVGYLVHEPARHGYVVRERDAHAWCLAWDAAAGTWVDFDTTPGSWIAAEEQRASWLESLSDVGSWVRFQIAKFKSRWAQTKLRQYILWALVPVLAFLLYQIVFRRGRRRPGTKSLSGDRPGVAWPGVDSEFYRLESRLAGRAVPRAPAEPFSGWLTQVLADPGLAGLQSPMRELLHLHYRHRFDPTGLNAAERERLRREVEVCLAQLDRLKPAAD